MSNFFRNFIEKEYLSNIFNARVENTVQMYRLTFLFFVFYILGWKVILGWQGETLFFPWEPKVIYSAILLLLVVFGKKIKSMGFSTQKIILALSISGILYLNYLFLNNPFNYALTVWYTITLSILPMSIFRKEYLYIYFIVVLLSLINTVLQVENPIYTKLPFALAVSLSVGSTTFLGLLRFYLVERLKKKRQRMECFARMNAHHIRGPISRIKGLVQLSVLESKNCEIIDMIKDCADELDEISKQAQRELELPKQ